MAEQSYLVDINLNGNQIKNVAVDVVTADPATPATGQIWFNSTDGTLKYYDGSVIHSGLNDLTAINAQTGTSYTLALTDRNKTVTLSNAAAITLTVPPNSSVAFPVGTVIAGRQIGAGQVTIAGAVGVTVSAGGGLKWCRRRRNRT